jgi:hypothetical protein
MHYPALGVAPADPDPRFRPKRELGDPGVRPREWTQRGLDVGSLAHFQDSFAGARNPVGTGSLTVLAKLDRRLHSLLYESEERSSVPRQHDHLEPFARGEIMKNIRWSLVVVPVLAAMFVAAPAPAEAQGPPAGVLDRIPAERQGEARRGGNDAREILRGQNQRTSGCAPGLEVARGTPAGAVLGAIFGRGGPASHARPGCQDRQRTDRAQGEVLDRLPIPGRDTARDRDRRRDDRRGGW